MKASPPKKLGRMMEKWRKKKKGQFVVYTKDGKRFVVPLCYLDHPIFKVLLEMAEEEYGLTIHGPLEVPCEKELMEYILNLLKKNPPADVEKALLSVTTAKELQFLLPSLRLVIRIKVQLKLHCCLAADNKFIPTYFDWKKLKFW